MWNDDQLIIMLSLYYLNIGFEVYVTCEFDRERN